MTEDKWQEHLEIKRVMSIKKPSYRPIWEIAAENNERPKVVTVKKVYSLPDFIGL